ncbi:MAG: phosphoribosylanthranilate isomerase, partial [Trichococcus flocculiformis]
MVKVKICGLKRVEDAEMLNELRPDFAGFIFAPSKRQISLEQALEIRAALDEAIPAVGVFVNEPIENIVAIVESR